MGDRSRLEFDLEADSVSDSNKDSTELSSTLTAFGPVTQIFSNLGAFNGITILPNNFHVTVNSEYLGTPWAYTCRLTKREIVVAKLHTTLKKLNLLESLTSEQFDDFRWLCIKRLKKAKWAKYQQKKVKSPR